MINILRSTLLALTTLEALGRRLQILCPCNAGIKSTIWALAIVKDVLTEIVLYGVPNGMSFELQDMRRINPYEGNFWLVGATRLALTSAT